MTQKGRKNGSPEGSPNGSPDGAQKVSINGDMTIYQAQENKDALLKALRSGNQLEIDLSDVEEFDSAGFQLLCLLKQEADRLQKKGQLLQCSPTVVEVLDLFGVTDKLTALPVRTGEEQR